MRFHKTILLVLLLVCQTALAEVSINEIMYDLSGSDTDREWIEIVNSGSGSVTIATSTWKFFEGDTNHSLSLFQGSGVIPAGGFAVIADNPEKFLFDWPRFAGTIFDSTFSLGNSGESIALKIGTTTIVDQVTYASTAGAAGDGNSLQRVGGVWKAMAPTPGFGNTGNQSATTPATTTADTSANSDASSATATSSSDIGRTNWPVEPQIISRIVGPSTAIAGADTVFKGEAVGLDKKPVHNARYLWNFGDGSVKEGESVMHAYNFPADYLVILEVSSGNFEGSSRLKVTIIPADIIVGDVVSGFEGKIELVNNAKQELDLSWWRVKSGNNFFSLPKNTKILAGGRLPLASAVMGFAVDDSDVALLYPNGAVAYKYEKVVVVKTPLVAVASNESQEKVSVKLAVVSPPTALAVPVREESSKTAESSNNLAQTAAVARAVDTAIETSAADSATASASGESSSLWLYGLGGVILLGLGFALYPKATASAPKKNAVDEFTIIED